MYVTLSKNLRRYEEMAKIKEKKHANERYVVIKYPPRKTNLIKHSADNKENQMVKIIMNYMDKPIKASIELNREGKKNDMTISR